MSYELFCHMSRPGTTIRSAKLAQLREHVEERLITHLRKRHKVRDRKMGYLRFKRRALYEKYGLYKVHVNRSGLGILG